MKSLEEFRLAVQLTHTLWGGRFNPIIPLQHRELAHLLVKTFQVDCLYCISQSPEADAIRSDFEYLFWPGFNKELFIQGNRGPVPTFLDVYHPVRHLYEANIADRDHPIPGWRATFFKWEPGDPLADVLLATFGAYPTKEAIGIDYKVLFHKYLAANEVEIGNTAALPGNAFNEFTPSALTTYELDRVAYTWGRDDPGFYYGTHDSLSDLVNFWNLRASGIEVFFYDPAFAARLKKMTDNYAAALRARPKKRVWENRVAIWKESHDFKIDLVPFGEGLVLSSCSPATWNGLNVIPSVMGFEEKSILGTLSEDGRSSATFELPPKPFFDDVELHNQRVVVSVHPLVVTENIVFKPPFLPQLNEYYGRQSYFQYHSVRSEPEGIGIITGLRTSSLTIRALDPRALVSKIFEVFGISAKSSPAGLVGMRLIEQMGGLQGCRVFKIGGVRNLIRDYSPDQWFTRSGAIQAIRQADKATGRMGFTAHESLYIEARDRGRLKPDDVLDYLLAKGVFRAGLCLLCPKCELESWVHIDDVRTISRCGYCGYDFNITPQLRDRDWAYRRSGLFGRTDNQGGGIPVALTLQQLDTALSSHIIAYATGTELEPTSAPIQKCETDLVLLVESLREKRLQIVIGECKGQKEITTDDARKMGLVADALTKTGDCEAFIVFSKTSSFSPEEVERCKLAQGEYTQRVIILSDRELEPYNTYERAAKEFEMRGSDVSLQDMVEATQELYFNPRPKAPAEPGGQLPNPR